jgi:hypothetical protein
MTQLIFEKIYDKYAAMLYGIALEICPTEECAEQVFIKTFNSIYVQNKTRKNSPSFYVELIKLIIETAKMEVCTNDEQKNLKLKQFQNTALLQLLISDEQRLDTYCKTNEITRQDGLLMIRYEFNILRKFNEDNKYKTVLV